MSQQQPRRVEPLGHGAETAAELDRPGEVGHELRDARLRHQHDEQGGLGAPLFGARCESRELASRRRRVSAFGLDPGEHSFDLERGALVAASLVDLHRLGRRGRGRGGQILRDLEPGQVVQIHAENRRRSRLPRRSDGGLVARPRGVHVAALLFEIAARLEDGALQRLATELAHDRLGFGDRRFGLQELTAFDARGHQVHQHPHEQSPIPGETEFLGRLRGGSERGLAVAPPVEECALHEERTGFACQIGFRHRQLERPVRRRQAGVQPAGLAFEAAAKRERLHFEAAIAERHQARKGLVEQSCRLVGTRGSARSGGAHQQRLGGDRFVAGGAGLGVELTQPALDLLGRGDEEEGASVREAGSPRQGGIARALGSGARRLGRGGGALELGDREGGARLREIDARALAERIRQLTQASHRADCRRPAPRGEKGVDQLEADLRGVGVVWILGEARRELADLR